MSWSQQRMSLQFRSAFGSQDLEVSPPVWKVSLEAMPLPQTDSNAGKWKTLMLQLKGSTNQLALWDITRPAPLGTLRGSLTFAVAASQGDTSITINSDSFTTGDTLLAGDLIGFGSGTTQQVVMVMETAACDASGDIVLTVEAPLRNAFSLGTAVTWDKPKALFRVQNQNLGWDYDTTMVSGFGLELQEDWRP